MMICMVISIFAAPLARGQSIWPSTLNATGGSGIIGGNVYDYSIGEIALVNTFTTASIIVTQGLLQTDLHDGTNAVAATSKVVSQLQVFPNPSKALVNVQFNAACSGKMNLALRDITGRLILQQKVDVLPGSNLQQVDISSLAAAIYMLEVAITPAEGIAETSSYKIQKLQ